MAISLKTSMSRPNRLSFSPQKEDFPSDSPSDFPVSTRSNSVKPFTAPITPKTATPLFTVRPTARNSILVEAHTVTPKRRKLLEMAFLNIGVATVCVCFAAFWCDTWLVTSSAEFGLLSVSYSSGEQSYECKYTESAPDCTEDWCDLFPAFSASGGFMMAFGMLSTVAGVVPVYLAAGQLHDGSFALRKKIKLLVFAEGMLWLAGTMSVTVAYILLREVDATAVLAEGLKVGIAALGLVITSLVLSLIAQRGEDLHTPMKSERELMEDATFGKKEGSNEEE